MNFPKKIIIGPVLMCLSYLYGFFLFKSAKTCTGLCNDTNDLLHALILAVVLLSVGAGVHIYLYRKYKVYVTNSFVQKIFRSFYYLSWLSILFVLLFIGEMWGVWDI